MASSWRESHLASQPSLKNLLRVNRGIVDLSETAKRGSRERWADGVLRPAQQESRGCATDPALAWSHAAAGVQFRAAPADVLLHVAVRHILAPAHGGVSLRKGFQLLAQGKRAVQHASEAAGPLACREARTCVIPPACRSKTRDLALHQGR